LSKIDLNKKGDKNEQSDKQNPMMKGNDIEVKVGGMQWQVMHEVLGRSAKRERSR